MLRHAATIGEFENGDSLVANFSTTDELLTVSRLSHVPYAMFECKRVGIEEGMKKGPQTIEKAKQGPYVARAVSSLQRVVKSDGSVAVAYEDQDGNIKISENYFDFLKKAIRNKNQEILRDAVVTLGIVGNHGNWFSEDVQNKEMQVLAGSYDWLLFLKDDAMAEFIEDVLQGSSPDLQNVRRAFRESFGTQEQAKKKTKFTKVPIDALADRELTQYFSQKQPWGNWFNVITPAPSVYFASESHDSPNTLDSFEDSSNPYQTLQAVAITELKKSLNCSIK